MDEPAMQAVTTAEIVDSHYHDPHFTLVMMNSELPFGRECFSITVEGEFGGFDLGDKVRVIIERLPKT